MDMTLRYHLLSLTVYRGVLEKPAVSSLLKLIEAAETNDAVGFYSHYGQLCAYLNTLSGSRSLPCAIAADILADDNAFSSACSADRKPDASLFACAKRDLHILWKAAYTSTESLMSCLSDKTLPTVPSWSLDGEPFTLTTNDWGDQVDVIAAYHSRYGCGRFAQHKAFLWRAGRLMPVEHPDPITLKNLKGYEYQRQIAIDNTLSFINGFEANNMLLYGDRGTGKSSTVKALLNEYAETGLRMIEVPKEYLRELPDITEQIAGLPMKFILFIDDLSFNANDDNFAALKAVLEGGLASRPSNVLIYATSNRRHLLKETFSDRDGDEVHRGDTVQESVSLSDRFGISLTFLLPDKQHFLEIVGQMADDMSLKIDRDRLLAAAERWALERGGRSPRYARQFMIDLQAKLGRNEPI